MGAWRRCETGAVIRCIAAIDSCRGLATDAGIPWHLPGDSAYFRAKTSKGVVVMGRATYLEFAAPLGEQENFVLTHSADPLRPGFRPVAALADVFTRFPDDDVWVIGGAAVYALAVDSAEELLLTQVTGDFCCTKFFPPYDRFTLVEASGEHREEEVSYRFERWARRRGVPPVGG
jgi:dihydrofolate reductase